MSLVGPALAIGGAIFAAREAKAQEKAQRRAADADMLAVAEEADLRDEQADINLEEAEIEAGRIEEQNRKFKAKQSLAFLKNGISLANSPLLVLAETDLFGREEVAAFRGRAEKQFDLDVRRTDLFRATGRSRLLSTKARAKSTRRGVQTQAAFQAIGRPSTARSPATGGFGLFEAFS